MVRFNKLEDVPKHWRKQIDTAHANKNATHNIPGTTANGKQCVSNEQVAKKEAQRFDGQVNVHYYVYTPRLRDPDGNWTKYLTDGIVSAGVLQDDSAKFIKEVSVTQIKSKEKKTVIIISEV